MPKPITYASWVGKAAYEIGRMTSHDGKEANRRARALADAVTGSNINLADIDAVVQVRLQYNPHRLAEAARLEAIREEDARLQRDYTLGDSSIQDWIDHGTEFNSWVHAAAQVIAQIQGCPMYLADPQARRLAHKLRDDGSDYNLVDPREHAREAFRQELPMAA